MKSGPIKIAPEMRTSQKIGLASTVLNSIVGDQRPAYRPKKSSKPWLGALILIGGGAAMAGYLIKRNHDHTAATSKVVEVERDAGAGSALGSAAMIDDAPTAVATTGSAGSAMIASPSRLPMRA